MTIITRLVLLVCLALFGCGSSTAEDLSKRDPRCLAACPVTMPVTADVGDVCSTASRVACVDECEARIAGVATTCANCLTEGARFYPDDRSAGASCAQTTCTITGWAGMCTYPVDDTAKQAACEKQVSPRREVECMAKFKATTSCSTVCK